MADPREVVDFRGIGYSAATYNHDGTIVYDDALPGGSAQVGLAVTLDSDSTVSLVGDGEQVEGKLIKVEPGGVAVVQNGGVVTLPGGTSATLTVGLKIVGDLLDAAEGYIQAVSTQHTLSRGTIVDSSDATAVVVRLESGGPN